MAESQDDFFPTIAPAKLVQWDVIAELTVAMTLASAAKAAQAAVKGVLGRTTINPVLSIRRDNSEPAGDGSSSRQILTLPTTAITANVVQSALGALPPAAVRAPRMWCVPAASLTLLSDWESKTLPEVHRTAATAFGITELEAKGYILQLNKLVVCRAGVGMLKVGMAAALNATSALGGVIFSLPGEWEGGEVQIYHSDGTTMPALVASSDSHSLTTTHYTVVSAGAAVSVAPITRGCRALLLYAFSGGALANPVPSLESAISQAEHALVHVSLADVDANCRAVTCPSGSNAFMPARRVTYLCKGVAEEDTTYASTATPADTWETLSDGDKGAAECLIAAASRVEGACVFFCTLKVDGEYGYTYDSELSEREEVLISQAFSLTGWQRIYPQQPSFSPAGVAASLSSVSSRSSSNSSTSASTLAVDMPSGYTESVWRDTDDVPDLEAVRFFQEDGKPNKLLGHVLPTQRAKDLLARKETLKPGSSRTVSCPAIVVCLHCTPENLAVHLRGGDGCVHLLQGMRKEVAAATLRAILAAPIGLERYPDYAGLVSVCTSVGDLECARLLLALPALPPSHVIPLVAQLCASTDSGAGEVALASLTAAAASATLWWRVETATCLLNALPCPRGTTVTHLCGAYCSVDDSVSPSDKFASTSGGVSADVRALVLRHLANGFGTPWQRDDSESYGDPSVVSVDGIDTLLTAIGRLPPCDAKPLMAALLTANGTCFTTPGCIQALAAAEGREDGCVVEPVVACIASAQTTSIAVGEQLVDCALAWARAAPPSVVASGSMIDTVSAPGTVAPALSGDAWRAMRDRIVLTAVTRVAPFSTSDLACKLLHVAAICRSAAAFRACIQHVPASVLSIALRTMLPTDLRAHILSGDWAVAARTAFTTQEWLAPLVAKVVASSAPGTGSIVSTSWGRVFAFVGEATEAACQIAPSAASDAECDILLELCAKLVEHLTAVPASTPPLQSDKDNTAAIEACAAAIEFAMWVWVYPMTRKGVTDHSMSDTTVIASVGPGAASAPTSPTTRERLAGWLWAVCRPGSALLAMVESSPTGMQAVVATVNRVAASCTPGGAAAFAAVDFATSVVETIVGWLKKLAALPVPVLSFVYPARNGFTPCGAGDCRLCSAVAAFLPSAAPTLSLAITNDTQYQHLSRLLRHDVDVHLAVRETLSKSLLLTKRNLQNAAALASQQRVRATGAVLLAGLTQVPIAGSAVTKAPLRPGAQLMATLARLVPATTGTASSTPHATGSLHPLTTPASITGDAAATVGSFTVTAPLLPELPSHVTLAVPSGVSGVKRPFTAIASNSSITCSGGGSGVQNSTARSSPAPQAAVGLSAKRPRIEAIPITTTTTFGSL